MRIVWWTILLAFVVSTGVTLTHVTSGYTGATTENGRYFASYRSTRYEVSKQEYDQISYSDPLARWSGAVMFLSACGIGGLDKLRRPGGR